MFGGSEPVVTHETKDRHDVKASMPVFTIILSQYIYIVQFTGWKLSVSPGLYAFPSSFM